jgi:DNA-binding transcriptional regulator LsrR (DeoR family)
MGFSCRYRASAAARSPHFPVRFASPLQYRGSRPQHEAKSLFWRISPKQKSPDVAEICNNGSMRKARKPPAKKRTRKAQKPRPKRHSSANLLLDVARLRFKDKLTNLRVAAKLQIAPRKVKDLLEESVQWLLREQERLARIESGESEHQRLEQQLCEGLGLKKVRVVPRGRIETDEDYTELVQRWARAAVDHFETVVNSGELRDIQKKLHVAVSGGETLLEVMNALPDRMRRDVYFYASAFLGRSLVHGSSHPDPLTNTTVAWARSGRLSGHCIYATVSPPETDKGLRPSFSERKEQLTRQLALVAENRAVEAAANQLDHVSVAFAGLGVVSAGRASSRHADLMTATGLLKKSMSDKELADDGIVGDLGCCFFDDDGNGSDDWQFFLTGGHYSGHRGVEFYRHMVTTGRQVIVAAGIYKTRAIIAALKGKLFNVWITDDVTAREVLASNVAACLT